MWHSFARLHCRPSKGVLHEIWLSHRRLGHLSFEYLKKLKPHLFHGLNIFEFRCDVCELAKSHRVPYLPRLNKCSQPFIIIHFDIWGPTRIPSLF